MSVRGSLVVLALSAGMGQGSALAQEVVSPMPPALGTVPGVIANEENELSAASSGQGLSVTAKANMPDASSPAPFTPQVLAGSDGKYISCPTGLLREAWASVLTTTALETFAVEEEVLRLCNARQKIIVEILQRDAELAALLPVPLPTPAPAPEATALRAGAALITSPLSVAPETEPGTSPANTAEETADTSSPGATAATQRSDIQNNVVTPRPPEPVGTDQVEVASSQGGSWTHVVRFRVRSGNGAWQADILSTHTPPPAAPIIRTREDGTTWLEAAPLPEPNAPVSALFRSGDTLPGGEVITAINATGVFVRKEGATARAPEALPVVPRLKPQNTSVSSPCVAEHADARDVVYCKRDT